MYVTLLHMCNVNGIVAFYLYFYYHSPYRHNSKVVMCNLENNGTIKCPPTQSYYINCDKLKLHDMSDRREEKKAV